MRATDIESGESYAVAGREIQLARVRVLAKKGSGTSAALAAPPRFFHCRVEQGEVYIGWTKRNGVLDMAYAGPGDRVDLMPRQILRPWSEEQARRAKLITQRDGIRDAMSEMDRLLIDLGLPDSQVHLVQLPDGYLAVTVLGIEEVRKLHEQKSAQADQGGVGLVSGQTGSAGAGPEIQPP